MASGGKSDGKKSPVKKAGGSGRKGSSGKTSAKRPGKKPVARRKLPPLPLLAVWLLAVLALGAILYFGAPGKLPPPPGHDRGPVPAETSQSRTATLKDDAAGKQAHPEAARQKPAPVTPRHGPGTTQPAPAVQPAQPKERPSAPPEPAKAAPAAARNGHPQKPEAEEKPAQPAIPAGPALPSKPQFSSKDLPPDPAPSKELLALNKPSPAVPAPGPPPPTAPVMARVAIVIDDIGADANIAAKFLALPFPVTLSVLPHQARSAEIARLAHERGREVMLHLPMEPQGYPKASPGKGALLVGMSEDALRREVRSALDVSPYFRGVNNHMGSRMTEDSRSMKTVLEEVNRRGLFFLDSRTSPKSRAWSLARELKIPCAGRDVFLDHNPSAGAVRSQVSRLIRLARVRGTAIAIGHPRQATLSALEKASAEFQKQGIKVVAASELMSGR